MPLRLHLSQTSLLPRQPLPGNHQPMTVDLLSPDTAWRGYRDSVDAGFLLPRRSFQTLHSVSLTWWKTTPMNSGSLQKTKQAKANPALHPRISRLSTHGVRLHRLHPNFSINVIEAIILHEICLFSVAKPGAPSTPEILRTDKTSADLQWSPPTEDGGAPITSYIIEYRPSGAVRWNRANSSPVLETTFSVADLREGSEYEFRVSAENKAGVGPASPPSKTVRVEKPLGEERNSNKNALL